MRNRILIFPELEAKLPGLSKFCDDEGVELLPIVECRQVLREIPNLQAKIVILSLSMPGMSGIEMCRRLKEQGQFGWPKVVIVASAPRAESEEKALDAGCDLFLKEKEVKVRLLPFLRWEWTPQALIERREAPRFEVNAPVQIVAGRKARFGSILNASRSGLYLAMPESLPDFISNVIVRYETAGQGEVDLPMRVIRIEERSTSNSGTRFGLAAEFATLSFKQKKRLFRVLTKAQHTRLHESLQNLAV